MKKTFVKKVLKFATVTALTMAMLPVTAFAKEVRPCDAEVALEGCTFIGIDGKYEDFSAEEALAKINEIRKEACEEGVINPSSGEALTLEDYVPAKWSAELELIAGVRATEAAVFESHTRPNGEICFTIGYNEQQSWGENLAWNYSGYKKAISQWYEEKADWVAGDENAITGHYTQIIDPKNEYIGLSCFRRQTGGWYSVAAEFSTHAPSSSDKQIAGGKICQTIEVKESNLSSEVITGKKKVKIGKTKQLSVVKLVSFPGIMGGTNESNADTFASVKWESSDKSVLKVDADGIVSGVAKGTATVTATLEDGTKLTYDVKVKAPKKAKKN